MPNASEILNARLGYGLTRSEFARRLGVTRQCVWYWEADQARMSATTWQAVRSGLVALALPTPDLIRRARRVAHLKQHEAATLLGVAGRHWQSWECGRVTMPALKWTLFLRLARLPSDFTLDYDPLKRAKGLYR